MKFQMNPKGMIKNLACGQDFSGATIYWPSCSRGMTTIVIVKETCPSYLQRLSWLIGLGFSFIFMVRLPCLWRDGQVKCHDHDGVQYSQWRGRLAALKVVEPDFFLFYQIPSSQNPRGIRKRLILGYRGWDREVIGAIFLTLFL